MCAIHVLDLHDDDYGVRFVGYTELSEVNKAGSSQLTGLKALTAGDFVP